MFLLPVCPITVQQLLKINLVRVELGPFDTSEARFSAHGDATPAAHPGTVDHDWIQTGNGVDTPFARQLGHGAHHGNRTDHVYKSRGGSTGLAPVTHQIHDIPGEARRTVICGPQDLVAGGLKLIAEDDPIRRAGAAQSRYWLSSLAKCPCDGRDLGHTHATSNA